MSINLVISEFCCNFKELTFKQLQTKIAMITEDKVTEIFCMADDFCKSFDAMTTKYTLKPTGKRKYHRNSTMSKAEVMLIIPNRSLEIIPCKKSDYSRLCHRYSICILTQYASFVLFQDKMKAKFSNDRFGFIECRGLSAIKNASKGRFWQKLRIVQPSEW